MRRIFSKKVAKKRQMKLKPLKINFRSERPVNPIKAIKERLPRQKGFKAKQGRKMTIRRKLVYAFVILNVLIFISGVNSVYNIEKLKNQLNDLYEIQLKGIQYIKDAQVSLMSMGEDRYNIIMATHSDERYTYSNSIKSMMDRFESSLAAYKEIETSEEGKKRIAEIEKFWSELKTNEDVLIQSANKNLVAYAEVQAKANRLLSNSIGKEVDALIESKNQLALEAYEECNKLYKETRFVTTAIIALSILIGFFISLTMSRMIGKPIAQMAHIARNIAEGNLTIESVDVKSNDEIRDLADSFNAMINSLHAVISNVLQASEKVAVSSQQLSFSSQQTTTAAEEVASTINQLASGAGKQAEDASQASGMVNQIAESIQQVAENANSAAMASTNIIKEANNGLNEAKKAVEKIQYIQKVTEESSESVKALGNESSKIGEIVEVIKEIAGQTNLLALNAAIEAARAGEAGKGFAVVADEVRKLAEESSSSAVQIANLIGNIQNETNKVIDIMSAVTNEVSDGVEAVNRAGNSFENIFNHINNITSQIQELSASVQQVAEGSRSMNESIESIASIAEETAASSEEISAASEEQTAAMEEIANMAKELSKLAEELQSNVAGFRL
ncbi:methyl-accepting chemotaxis protein [Lutispora thermophila]|uniref:Methyl-accepting chemotaxis protein n=1 Tax=Lutispora thermophila DSM 19022 TaxID=1122184 RepID=A0A1M6E2Y0_9FIRM|nr:methyl-accepting chemotaxis protein [Lutispora thermophila]SHI79608.1 methyl-accepting chemotaxis protein [Lutispora thermophila DSM 19022]